MALISLRNVSYSWGGPPLLDDVSLEVSDGERIGLLGRNGAGKSTLMKIIAGDIAPDGGEIVREAGVRVARLVQEVPEGTDVSIAELVAAGWDDVQTPSDRSDTLSEEAATAWQRDHAVEKILSKMQLDGGENFNTLSSGMKRRALLAKALVREPEVLLLDEPTNHLDIESIRWLERFLKGYDGTLVFVTHDRVFLQALADRIVEIDRAKIFDWTCDYATFLRRKAAALEAEEKQNAAFDKKLAEEETWIRQGIKARRTRNEGRVRALKKMREEYRARRKRVGNVQMQTSGAERSGQLVIEAKNLSFTYGDEPIVKDFSVLITRGEKIGLIGPNGSGKTTLLKLLLGDLKPDSGSIRHGTRLQVIYFDQLREQIDDEKTVAENVGEGQEVIEINGAKKHIYGYLQDFLFTPERARRPARYMSGGERNRMLLARLFKKPSNLMVLDEPTNDLDQETLELLEELVGNYSGTLLLVSHDRAFLDNTVTSTLAFRGRSVIREYAGGYDDYLRQTHEEEVDSEEAQAPAASAPAAKPTPKPSAPAKRKLTYNEQRELERLPAEIEELEQEQSRLHAAMADPEFFKQDSATIARETERLAALDVELTERLERWEQLESRA